MSNPSAKKTRSSSKNKRKDQSPAIENENDLVGGLVDGSNALAAAAAAPGISVAPVETTGRRFLPGRRQSTENSSIATRPSEDTLALAAATAASIPAAPLTPMPINTAAVPAALGPNQTNVDANGGGGSGAAAGTTEEIPRSIFRRLFSWN
ncbi:uncharacterized protein LOC111519326 [Drosophila willistoni]|uniref:uncharacterized protein LOC111519326 n=1 Tax=Drosophila willistoni TaxID=7260 RepID=UPI000C26C228|nr:uncharacterized protein LOC111519326 [Drosophila willistoni]